MAVKLFYNSRCSKSRGARDLLDEQDENIEIVKYLENPPDEERLREVINLLNITPMELVRTKEKEWKKNFKDKRLSDDQVIDAMIAYPKLIQRPIAVKGQKAVLGRPPQKVLDIL